ncbi:MAG: GNAT family N-acetyltransferase [Dehalococcoidia bacterium]|nr:GNAT family N-acetyltransferase [Dehalococcoidia bacterium]
MSIRPAAAADRAAVIDILRDTPEFAQVDFEVACELLDAYLHDVKRSGYWINVAEWDGTLAGYACFGPTPLTDGVWDVYWVAVKRDLRKRGIGRALIDFVEGEVRRMGGRMLLIETSSTEPYQAARQMYLKMGYTIVAEIGDFYKKGDAKIVFQKKLQ